MKSEITLRSRLVILVVAAIFPLFGLSLVKAVLSIDVAIARATRSLEFSASLVAANQGRAADSARQLLTAVAAMPQVTGKKSADCERYFDSLLSQLPVYFNIGVIGSDGFLRCHSTSNGVPSYAGGQAYFKAAITQRSFVADGYPQGAISDKPSITFALPVMDASGTIAAVAYAGMYLSELTRGVSIEQLPAESDLLILDRQGLVLSSKPDGAAVAGLPAPSRVLTDAIRGGVQGVMEGTDSAGVRRIYAFLPSDRSGDAPSFVALSMQRDATMAPAQLQLALEFFVLALVTLLSGWIAWMIGGSAIVRPTSKILQAIRDIKAGQLEIRIALQAGSGSEFNRIAEGIHGMAESLHQRERDLASELAHSRQAHAELEQLQAGQAASYAELRATQRRLVEAQRLGRIGHWELDLQTGRLTLSDELHELFGVPVGTLDGQQEVMASMVHPDDRAQYLARRDMAQRSGRELDIEYRIVTGSGAERWMHQLSRVHADPSGKPVCRTGVVQEITARKQSELALAHSTWQLRRTGQMARIGGWEVRLDTLHAEWSDELYRIHEIEAGESLGALQAIGFYAPEAQRTIRDALRAAVRHGRSWDLELPLITAKGRRIWVRTQGQPVTSEGRVVSLAGALQDITFQHESLEDLRLLETSISRLNDMVLITEAGPYDEPGPRIVYVNDAFVRHTGYSRQEVLGNTPRLLEGPNTQRSELDRIRLALRSWEPVRVELINYTKAGAEFWVELDMVPVANASGSYTHWIAVQRDVTQRKLSEQALADSEQRYGALFESAPVPMWACDAGSSRFLTVNSAAVSSYGYSVEEFRSMTLIDIRPEQEQEDLTALFGELREHDCIHRRKDGSIFPVRVVSKPIQYAGRPASFVVALDVTGQMRAEKEVQDYLFTLQRAADAAQAIIRHQTLQGMLQEVAVQSRAVIGAHQAVVSLTTSDSLVPAVNAVSISGKYAAHQDFFATPAGSGFYASVCNNNRPVRMTQEELQAHPQWKGFASPAGRDLALRGWLAVPLMGRNGLGIGLLQLSDKYEGEFTLQDEYVAMELAQLASIAIENAQLLEQVNQLNAGLEQKVAERTAALERQQALFRALADQAPQVVWTADPEGGATYFNGAWFELVGGALQDWLGTRWLAVVHPEDVPEVSATWTRAKTTGAPFTGIRRLLAKDGSYHSMAYRASPVMDGEGGIAFWVGIDADITEIKTIEAALRLSNQELEAFSYSVSHDLRAPLNTIDGFSRLLAKQLTGNTGSKSQHYLSRIQAGVAQMGKLIEDLLSLAHVTRMQLRHEVVDLSALSRDILEEWRVRQPERQVAVEVETGLRAQGDARLVRVMMENMLGNAWKFTSRQTNARIVVGKKLDIAGQPVFFVADNGAGFDMAYAGKLFVAFQRLHTVAEFPGTGVGLATVSRVVARHGGRLWAEALAGVGATFFFTLPNVPGLLDKSA